MQELALRALKEALLPLVALQGDYTDADGDDIERLVDAVLEACNFDREELAAEYEAGEPICPMCRRPLSVNAMHGYELKGKPCPDLIA